jgi:hypothetical protein
MKSIRSKLGIPITIIIAALATQAQAQFTFTTNSGAITITGYTGPGGDVTIPPTIDGLPVTRIGNGAFRQNFSLLSVTIPDSVTNIGYAVFNHCIALTNVTLSQNLRTISDDAFSYCEFLPGIAIPDAVTYIGFSAFDSCYNLASITISSNVTDISANAFVSCLKLTTITVDALNPSYASVDGVLFDKSVGTLVQCPGGKTGSYSIPASARKILSRAFWSCQYLTSLTIPGTVTNIGEQVFSGCSRLTAIIIPSSVTAIGHGAFGTCAAMTDITVDPLNASYCSVNGALFDKGTNILFQCPAGKAGTYNIPNGATAIGDYAFSRCFGLTNVTMPNSVNTIGFGAFGSCIRLTTMTVPAGVTNIDAAFDHCRSLQAVYFLGNAPTTNTWAAKFIFLEATPTVYYLPGTTGWGPTFAGRPTASWALPNPLILNNHGSFGVQSNGFGFTVSWATNVSLVVEVCTNIANPTWQRLQTNALTGGAWYFRDSQWTNYRSRFYRLRLP